MEGDNFSKQLTDFEQRIKSLKEIIKTKPMESLEEGIEEMQSAFEELQVAEEELRLQQEKLQATTYNLDIRHRCRHRCAGRFHPQGLDTRVSDKKTSLCFQSRIVAPGGWKNLGLTPLIYRRIFPSPSRPVSSCGWVRDQ